MKVYKLKAESKEVLGQALSNSKISNHQTFLLYVDKSVEAQDFIHFELTAFTPHSRKWLWEWSVERLQLASGKGRAMTKTTAGVRRKEQGHVVDGRATSDIFRITKSL